MTPTRIALLLTTALIVPVAAQAQTVETACNDLEGMIVAGLPENMDSSEDMTAIVDAGDGEACLVEITRIAEATGATPGTGSSTDVTVADTAETTVRLQDEVTIAGRVLLEQSAPQVNVQEGETDVEIEPGAPTVTVSEAQAEIVVRQAAANVTIDMPQPTIRIEQAAPEIIITMPDPSVSVGAAQPEVRVVQADPVITVTQAPPGVQLELAPVTDGSEGGFDVSDARTGTSYRAGETPEAVATEDADVTFTKSEPRVVMSDTDAEARVQIERLQPNVRFEQAEPVINFTSAGEPQVEFTQSGEPVVTFEQAAATGTMGTDATAAGTDTAAMDTDPAAAADMDADANGGADTAALTNGDAETDAATLSADGSIRPPADTTELPATDAPATDATATDGAAVVTETEVVETTAPVEIGGPAVEREGYNLAQVGEYQVDTLVGSNLYGVNDEDIGEIGDLVLDGNGGVSEVIVEIGGFLGLGEKEVRLPFERLSILRSNAGDVRTYIDATEEELEAMPLNE